MASLVSTSQQQLGLFDAVGVADRVIAQCFAVRAEVIDQTRRFSEAHTASIPWDARSLWTREEIAERELSSELAATLRIPERTAVNLLEESRALTDDLPATRAALAEGRISYRHAQTVVGQAWSIPPEGLAAFEQALLPAPAELTVAKLTHKARLLWEKLHPETITTRRATSIANRTSAVQAEANGMATLYLTPGRNWSRPSSTGPPTSPSACNGRANRPARDAHPGPDPHRAGLRHRTRHRAPHRTTGPPNTGPPQAGPSQAGPPAPIDRQVTNEPDDPPS